ncbi:MAG: efflux RND transporter permease subunit [Planctomycetota bacterium]
MLQSLVAWSVRNAGMVLVLALLLLGAAAFTLPRIGVDVFPDLESPRVTILTEAQGLGSEDVELLVTYPIESVMIGLQDVSRVRSTSLAGFSLVWIEFAWGTDVDRARQRVAERLTVAREALPEGISPTLAPVASLTGEVLQVALTSDQAAGGPSLLDLRRFAEFELRPRILALGGVASVSVIGGELPELQVLARQDVLRAANLELADLADAARGAHAFLEAGYLADDEGREVALQQTSALASAEDLARAAIPASDARLMRLGDVADVRIGPSPRRGSAGFDGAPAVILGITKAPGTNTLEVTRRVDAALEALAPIIPQHVGVDAQTFRQARFIERAVAAVLKVLGEAAVIVAIVLLMFLLDLRTALVTLTALPLSLAITALWIHWTGGGMNVMTLGGIAIAIGVLVDDAIIDVENVLRRLRENAGRAPGERVSIVEAVIAATGEIRPAMVQATFIIVLTFVPLFLLEGLEGRFFRPLGETFVVSLLASLLVALTVTPALCRVLLKNVRASRSNGHGGPLVRALEALYRPSLALAIRLRWLVLAASAAATVAALAVGLRAGTSFLPRFEEGMITVFVNMPPDTSLEDSEDTGALVAARIAGVEGVASVTRRTGRAEKDEHAEPVCNSEIEVALEEGVVPARVRAALDAVLMGVRGVTTALGQPIEHRLSHVLSGVNADLALDLYHEDQVVLKVAAEEVAAVLRTLPAARDVNAQRSQTVETLRVEWDREALAREGLSVRSAGEQLRAAMHGEVVGTAADGLARTDIVVRLADGERDGAADVAALELVAPSGARLPVARLAALEPVESPTMLFRQDARRKSIVSANVAEGSNIGDLVDAATVALAPIAERYGVELRFGGQSEAAANARRVLGLAGLGVMLLAFLMLRTGVGSWLGALAVLVNLPLGLIGGVAAIVLATPGMTLGGAWAMLIGAPTDVVPVVSLSTLVGFFTLFGIALRNGVLLASRFEALRAEGLAPLDAVKQGSVERLVPILMTALTAALGLLPLALAGAQPGTELLAPLAVVVLGGLASSTFLNLVVLPGAYLILRRR